MYIVKTEKRYYCVLLNVCLCDLKNVFWEKGSALEHKEDSLHKTTRPELRENQTNKKINDHKNTS